MHMWVNGITAHVQGISRTVQALFNGNELANPAVCSKIGCDSERFRHHQDRQIVLEFSALHRLLHAVTVSWAAQNNRRRSRN